MSVAMILLVLAALICFLLAAFGPTRWPNINLEAFGLALLTLYLLLQVISVA